MMTQSPHGTRIGQFVPSPVVRPLNAFTIDVEDYYQVSAFESCVSRDQWDQYPAHVVENTHKILDLLQQFDVRGTFFVLGWVAERCPELVRAIHRAAAPCAARPRSLRAHSKQGSSTKVSTST